MEDLAAIFGNSFGNCIAIPGADQFKVIAATGSVPLVPNIHGIKSALKRKQVVTGRYLLSGKVNLEKKAVVIGGGMIGCKIAEYLAERGQ